jgi:hypothetical protein
MRATRITAVPMQLSSSRFLSSFIDKERGDETRYFKNQDEELKIQLRAKLDALLESEGDHKEKVIELLGKALVSSLYTNGLLS